MVIAFTAEDGGSGLEAVTPETVLNTDGVEQSVTGTATDLAGNAISIDITGINIDKVAPEASLYNR